MISYKAGNKLKLDEVIDLYQDSTLGERRPIKDRKRIFKMIKNANLVVTAWDNKKMVGIARAISDFSYVTYLSDLAVRKAYQKKGIGKMLIKKIRQKSGYKTKIVLLAAPASKKYYPHIGFKQHNSAWLLKPDKKLKG